MFTPHNTHGAIGTLIAAHLSATVGNLAPMEFNRDDAPWRDDIISAPLPIERGSIVLSDAPGLGVEIVEKELARYAQTKGIAHFQRGLASVGNREYARNWLRYAYPWARRNGHKGSRPRSQSRLLAYGQSEFLDSHQRGVEPRCCPRVLPHPLSPLGAKGA